MTRFFPKFQIRTCFALVLLAIGLGGVLTPITAFAEPARQWLLADSSGQVRLVKSGLMPIALTVGDVFTKGDWVETGPDGRAVLQRGSETIVVAPNSRIGLPEKNGGPFMTRILQTLGTILLTVDKKANQHFEVQTPYMAAVVKGTTFTVGIQGQRAVVHVVEGLVEVRNLNTGVRGLVRPGQTGSVLSQGGSGVTIEGAQSNTGKPASAASASDPARKNAAEPGSVTIAETLGPSDIDLTAATGGLVREAASVGVAAIGEDMSLASMTMPDGLAATLVFRNAAKAAPLAATSLGGGGQGSGSGAPPPPPNDGN